MLTASDVIRAVAARRGIDLGAAMANPGDEPADQVRGLRLANQRRLIARTFDGTVFADAQPDHPAVARWVDRYRAGGDGGGPALPWLTVRGLQGRGKTHQGYGAIRVLAESAGRANQVFTWAIITHPEFNRRMLPQPDNSHNRLIEELISTDCVLFDDFCAGSFKDWAIEKTLDLVNARYRDNKMSVFTTNENWAGIDSTVGARVSSRMQEGTVITIAGPDRRLSMGEKL